MRLKRLVALTLIVAYAAVVQPRVSAGAGHGNQLAATQQPSVAASGQTISGNVRREDGTRVANQRLRLRNLDKGTIAAQTVSGPNGAFSFRVTDPGLYVVEAVDKGGSVEAVSSTLQSTTTPLTTDVILPVKKSTEFLSSTAFLLLAAASGAGIVAWAVAGDNAGTTVPASPER